MPSIDTLRPLGRALLPALCLSILLAAMPMPEAATPPPTPQPADLFDFWLGDWSVTWTNADGSAGKARNRVTRTLGGPVIDEQFEEDPADPAPLLRGHSISVLHAATGRWKQAWADNQGGFFAFTASVDGDQRIFATDLVTDGDQRKGQRMVFRGITRDAFTWDWEGTADGGTTWTLIWRLHYRR